MTIREALLSETRLPLLGLLFLLITGQMAVVIAALRDGWSRRTWGALLAFLTLSAAVFWLSLSVIAWEINFPAWIPEPPAWLAAFCACPAWAMWSLEAVTAAVLGLTVRDALRYRRDHVTPDSVKQAMDLLPVGIAFAAPDGAVVFRNLVMDHLSAALTGKLLTDWNVFRAAVSGDRVTAEGRIWQLRRLETPGSDLSQMTATDMTEQVRILEDLQAKNRKLRDIQLRLKIYNRQAERIIIAQELLTARMTVHDQLGSVLLESRHYLGNPASIDEKLLLQALRNANTYLLREYEGDDTAVDPLAEAVGMARAIGVRVELTGIPPTEEAPRETLAAAIRECAANTVKHAEGDRLSAEARHTDAGYTFTLYGNGQPPAGPVRETGGLLFLRTLVENRHGTMRVETGSGFRVIIRLPENEAHEAAVQAARRADSSLPEMRAEETDGEAAAAGGRMRQ